MDYEKSLEKIEKILEELKEESKNKPIIVEGDKDLKALRKLGFNSQIITINKGVSLTELCDKLSKSYNEIIILTDWDKRGGYLCSTIKKNLEGRILCNIYYRKMLALNCTIKKIEGLPSWINTLKKNIERFSI